MKYHHPNELRGKMLHCCLHGERKGCGSHVVRIMRVEMTKRTHELRCIVVNKYNAVTGKYDGATVRLLPEEWCGIGCGVAWYGRVVPLHEWLHDRVHWSTTRERKIANEVEKRRTKRARAHRDAQVVRPQHRGSAVPA